MVLFAVLFNLPKFFEVTFKTRVIGQKPVLDQEEGVFRLVSELDS